MLIHNQPDCVSAMPTERTSRKLVVRARSQRCSLPLSMVIETMRPQALESVPDMPPFLLGLSMVRGIPTPVVDLGGILHLPGKPTATRFVTIRAEARHVALAVEEVVGIRDLGPAIVAELPPLVDGSSGWLDSLGVLDDKLLLVLRATRVLPDELWERLESESQAS